MAVCLKNLKFSQESLNTVPLVTCISFATYLKMDHLS